MAHTSDVIVNGAPRRLTDLAVPNRPRGIAGVYDVAGDWTPVYDRTDAEGSYVAMGTSGNQFKNVPVIVSLMATLIDSVESGHDHDAEPTPRPTRVIGSIWVLSPDGARRTMPSPAPSWAEARPACLRT